MSSTIDIKKICEWCEKEFIAHKCTTRFCSKRCSEHSYKSLRREKHVNRENKATADKAIKQQLSGNYFTPRQCAAILGIGKSSVYRCLAEGLIPCIRLKGKTLISRASIDKMFENPPEYVKREKKQADPIEEFYTTKENWKNSASAIRGYSRWLRSGIFLRRLSGEKLCGARDI